jgi:putative ATPase
MRPRRLEDFLGQEHIVGEGKPLREAILRGDVTSIVLWGPPGSGKTTLAHIIATYTDRHFEPFSAVTAGVPQVREIIKQAQLRQEYEGKGTILFCDEIHRFNKAQQDAFLPWVERGVITLIGATTENPSFELNSALLSRVRVFVLQPLRGEHVRTIVEKALLSGEWGTGNGEAKALGEGEPGGGGVQVSVSDEGIDLITKYADGDARAALNALEALLAHVADRSRFPVPPSPVPVDVVVDVLERRLPVYDKSGESHYNLISALHKAVRGSDVEGALYWLARMLTAGEDGLYIARRVVRMATEDVGLADPRALSVALAAKESYHFLGSPEGELALAEAVIYLATAPKSNRVYEAWDKALDAARDYPNEPVPLHIRNAPTGLMKDLGYGKGYRYDHAEEGALAAGQEYLPDVLRGVKWYEPTGRGWEKTVGERLAWWEGLKRETGKGEMGNGT